MQTESDQLGFDEGYYGSGKCHFLILFYFFGFMLIFLLGFVSVFFFLASALFIIIVSYYLSV